MNCVYCKERVHVSTKQDLWGAGASGDIAAGYYVGCGSPDCKGYARLHKVTRENIDLWESGKHDRHYRDLLGFLSGRSLWPERDRTVERGVVTRVRVECGVKVKDSSVCYKGCTVGYRVKGNPKVQVVNVSQFWVDLPKNKVLKDSIYGLHKGDVVDIVQHLVGREPLYPHLGATSSHGYWGLKEINVVEGV